MEVFVEWSDDPYVKNGLPVILESALQYWSEITHREAKQVSMNMRNFIS